MTPGAYNAWQSSAFIIFILLIIVIVLMILLAQMSSRELKADEKVKELEKLLGRDK